MKRLVIPVFIVLVACAPVFALFDTPSLNTPDLFDQSDLPTDVAVSLPTDVAVSLPTDVAVSLPTDANTASRTDITITPPAVLLAAGDIADCTSDGDEATALVLEKFIQKNKNATVALLGDNVYPAGSLQRYTDCYAPSWGKFLSQTRAAQGNHDFSNGVTDGYYAYFGTAAGPKNLGYYAYSLGAWRVLVLNSNCWAVGGCDTRSKQFEWLKSELKTHPARCSLAYWHHPRYSSGLHGNTTEMSDIWDVLVDAGTEMVLSGHDHHFERFVPIAKKNQIDAAKGIRQFVVGTGGKSHYPALNVQPGSEARNSSTFGVLRLLLASSNYAWRFEPIQGQTFSDSGVGQCH